MPAYTYQTLWFSPWSTWNICWHSDFSREEKCSTFKPDKRLFEEKSPILRAQNKFEIAISKNNAESAVVNEDDP